MKEAPILADVSVLRLSIMRAYYGLIVIGTIAMVWPDLVSHTPAWGIDVGAQYALLAALTPFALLGLRYPLKMLPVILYEFTWKALWFIFVVAPLWNNGQMTEGVWANVFACGLAIVLTPIVMPWRYFWQTYVTASAEKWR